MEKYWEIFMRENKENLHLWNTAELLKKYHDFLESEDFLKEGNIIEIKSEQEASTKGANAMKKPKEKKIIGWAGFYRGEIDKTTEKVTDSCLYVVYVEKEDANMRYNNKNVRKVEIKVIR